MEWLNGQSSPMSQNIKAARKRLHKASTISKRKSQDSTASSTKTGHSIVPMVDLNDARWLDYIERTGLISSHRQSTSSERRSPFNAVPELAHLSSSDILARPSLDNLLSSSAPASKPRRFTLKGMTRVPFFKTGSSDSSVTVPQVKAAVVSVVAAEKRASIELIADQYNRILELRDGLDEEVISPGLETPAFDLTSDSIILGSQVFRAAEPPLVKPAPEPILLGNQVFNASDIRRVRSNSGYQTTTIDVPPQRVEPPEMSPKSDVTLIGFEEDAIYFKPVSFTPEPSPPFERSSYEHDNHRHSSSSNNNSQLCMELLTRQLAASLGKQQTSRTANHITPALQIWVMIETYEKLKTQLYNMDIGEFERRNCSLMFDSWLSALYSIHESLAPRPGVGGQQYEELLAEVLD